MDSLDRLRGWWASRQGLSPRSAPKTIEASIKQTGWLPTSGAPTAYLSIRARVRGASRAEIDRMAMDAQHVIEAPGQPGWPFLLIPPAELPMALRLHSRRVQAYIAKDPASEAACRAIASQIVAALDECPLASGEIRKAVSHRDAGILFQLTLSDLMLRGIVRRFPSDGRIDSTKYQFELRHRDDRPDVDGAGSLDDVMLKSVEYFLGRHGPATVDEMSAWGDLPKGRVRKALSSIAAESISVKGWTDEAWLRSADARRWRAFTPESHDRVAFLPYRDPFVFQRRAPKVLTTAADVCVLDNHYGKLVPSDIADVTEIDHHTIACGNELVGIWEYDPKAKAVVTSVWKPAARLRRLVNDAAEETTAFIRDELGDAKLSAVDPPEKRATRLAFCRGE